MKNVCSPVLWFMLPSNSTTVCVSLSGIQSVAMFAFCPCLLPLLLIVHDLSRKVGGGWFQRFRDAVGGVVQSKSIRGGDQDSHLVIGRILALRLSRNLYDDCEEFVIHQFDLGLNVGVALCSALK